LKFLKKDFKNAYSLYASRFSSQYECYEICQDAWTNYIQNSLSDLITTGKGQPNAKEGKAKDKK